MDKKNYINLANRAANIQINELKKIKKVFNNSFIKAVDLIMNCKGKVIFAGVGKSGLIARKISATFSSVGIPSFFCHPSEALHGDMGQIEKKDILIIFSYSGNTSELTNMLKYANRYRIKIIGVASKPDSVLLKASNIKLILPNVKEADITGMVPTSSTSITLLLGDCLATTVMYKKKFSKEKFKVFHPGGNIGKELLLARDIMLTGKKVPTINYKSNFKEALKVMNQKKLGIVVVLKNRNIIGLVTDGDLRRELKFKNISENEKLTNFITKNPLVVNENMPAQKALAIMNEKQITSLLIVSDKDLKRSKKTLKGIMHIHQLLQTGIK
jgi:arabinose-5-phosphate isomerase